MLEKTGIDMTTDTFLFLLHHFLTQVCTKERDINRRGDITYAETERDLEVVKLILKNKAREMILAAKDESYGNTPLHVTCSLHNVDITRYLLEQGCNREVKNNAERTPEEIVNNEIKTFSDYVPSKEQERTLMRLTQVKSLFA